MLIELCRGKHRVIAGGPFSVCLTQRTYRQMGYLSYLHHDVSDENPHRLKNTSATNKSVKAKRPANADSAMTASGPAIKGQERDLNPAASQCKTSTQTSYSRSTH